jgi:3-oxoacyl-[acyl-carrier protein] reductase
MELELNGKVAMVTGTNSEIGAAIATELPREGMHLCVVARDSDRLTQDDDSLGCISNTQVYVVSADLRKPAAPRQAIAQAVAQFYRVDLLVNNAGATGVPTSLR